MISPLKEADIDIVAVMHHSYYQPDGHASLLDRVKRILQKRYPTTPKISRDGQAVTITFNDFCVDVVPAFNRSGGGYLIPDSIQGQWIQTDPKKHVEIWAEANKKHSFNLVPIIKMMKAWNRMHSALFRSFTLETLTLQTLDGVTIADYPSGVRYVFDRARHLIRLGIRDPAGYGGNIASYLDTHEKVTQVVKRLEAAYKLALEAEDFDKRGKPDLAFSKWGIIFGDYFPTYS